MRQSQTPVWVRTDMVEAVVNNDGTLPKNWKPSRKRGRSSLTWGWARAHIVPTSSSTEPTTNNNTTTTTSSPFAHVKLRPVKNSPLSRENSPLVNGSAPFGGREQQSGVPVTVTLHDVEFAPEHLHGVTVTLDPSAAHDGTMGPLCMANAWWNHKEQPPDDLTSLVHLHEPAVVFCLKTRYEQDYIYTYTGKILLALNPFRTCQGLYGSDVIKVYSRPPTGQRPPPHIYAVAQDAYGSMMRAMSCHEVENQSILVSGESGAGKTVTTKIIMQYLATLSRNHVQNTVEEFGDIESQVLQSNPILESFGNARTVRNDNSSRFGKFIEIRFNARGCLVSASIETYLLEKVRLITQAPGERNYHIFYELLEGVSQKDRRSLKIGNVTAKDFRITASSGTFDRRDQVSDRDTYRELLQALTTVGFSQDEQTDLFTVVCALLHASNLTFVETSPEQACELDRSNPSLRSTYALLGVPVEKLEMALCLCAIEARGETLYKHMSIAQATKALDALLQATYSALFTHLVRRINSSIKVRQDSPVRARDDETSSRIASIGVLDIFGFESFDHNSFEQLCINYCNEALQQQFNKFVFKLEQQEYEREGIEWSFITFPDNQDVLDLIETKRTGILSILDEQCRLPSCTDMSFARATYEQCSEHARFTATTNQKVSGLFSIHHYAGSVEYNTANFLEKNKDELPKETTELLMSSENPFLASLGKILQHHAVEKLPSPPGSAASGTAPSRRQLQRQSSSLMRDSVGTQFASQLSLLRHRINKTTPHYVRCLKPNDDLLPDAFHPMVIADQLRCAGVLEAIRVSRVGFPQRYTHGAFLQRYHMLAIHEVNQKRRYLEERDLCQVLVKRALRLVRQMQNGDESSLSEQEDSSSPLSSSSSRTRDEVNLGIQMGSSKVFLRREAFDTLELLRGLRLDKAATKIQSMARMIAAQLELDIALVAVLIIQNFARRMEATRLFNQLRRRRAATQIQCIWRAYAAKHHFEAAILIALCSQSYYRGWKARELSAFMLLEHITTVVQGQWRRSIAVRRFCRVRRLVIRLQTLYRASRAREKLKRLKAEARNVDVLTAERDSFREEAVRLRRELESKQRGTPTPIQTNGHSAKAEVSPEVASLKQEVESLRRQLRKEKFSSKEKEMQSLAAESAGKDVEIAKLRDEIAFLRSPEGISTLEPLVPTKLSFDSPSRNHLSPERRVSKTSTTSGSRSPASKNRSPALNGVKTSPARSERSRDSGCCTDLGTSLLDEESIEDSAMMTVSPLDKPKETNVVNADSIQVDANQSPTDGQKHSYRIETLQLRKAVREGDAEALEDLLRKSKWRDQLVNECDESGQSPLHLAVVDLRWRVVGVLLGHDAVANAQDISGNTPLHVAPNASMIELLLEEGRANSNIPNMDGECALHLAVKNVDEEAVDVLLRHRANVNSADNTKWYTSLHLIAQADMDERAHLELLQDDYEEEKRKIVRVANLLCDADDPCKPDLNYQDWEGNTPLHHVVMLTSEPACDMLNLFLDRGGDPKIVNNRGQTPLHLLCHNDALRKVEVFQEMLHDILYHGADPNQTTLTGCTALHLSLYHRDVDSAIQLVNAGAELHLLWRKPKRWLAFWDDMGTSEILALDMVEDEHTLHRVLAAITKPQKWAPTRSWCMHCKTVLGSFARALHCRHCGRLVCGACSPRVLAAGFFPKSFEIYEASWVCVVCEKILVARKEDNSSTTQPTTSFQDDDDDRISF